MKRLIKKNYKFILGIVLGLIWSSGIAYAATILFDSDEVSYDNTTSGLSATNVQSALDELYVESTSYQLFEQRVSTIENKLYPVGSYYETSDSSFNPNTNSNWTGAWTKETITDDYIVEEGTSNGWTYRKWNSGLIECISRRTGTASLVGSNPLSSGAYWQPIYSYPFDFVEPPVISSSGKIGNGYSIAASDYRNLSSLKGHFYTSESGSKSADFSFYVIGYWKTYTEPSTIYRWHRTA